MHPLVSRAIHGTEPITTLVEDFYGPRGPLAAAGFEVRPQQREMSLRFAAQMGVNGRSVGIVEAPCGVGKGLAYLVPLALAALRAEALWYAEARAAALRDGKDPATVEPTGIDYPRKGVVSTANIALQGQLLRKDIPALSRMLGVEIRPVLMKSRSNYVCEVSLGERLASGDLEAQRIADWIDGGGSGDKEDIGWPIAEVWPRVSRGSEDCIGDTCDHYDGKCHWRRAVREWPHAHILVANHHWTALSGGIASVGYAIDEAHELEEALRGVQAHAAVAGSFTSLATRYAASRAPDDVTERDRQRARLEAIAAPLFAALTARLAESHGASERPPEPVPLPPRWVRASQGPALEAAFADLLSLRDEMIQHALDLGCTLTDARVRYVVSDDAATIKAGKAAASCANRAINLCRLYSAVVLGRPHPDWRNAAPWAIWAEMERDRKGEERLVAHCVPADVAPVFAGLHERYGTILLTSATLPAFQSLRLSLGLGVTSTPPVTPGWPSAWRTGRGLLTGQSLDSADGYGGDPETTQVDPLADDTVQVVSAPDIADPIYEVRLPSPYALTQQGILVVPRGPAPREDSWAEWAEEQVVQAVTYAGGGALVLATSAAQMKRYAAALRATGGWRVLCQGEAGRRGLMADFAADTDSVLVATRSMFQGLDVPGDSLRLVVIDRIPFAAPSDPVEDAVGRLLVERNRGGTAWRLRSLPMAAMVLVQGLGRLVRAQTDWGAAVLLDSRVLEPRADWASLRRALPPFSIHRDLSAIVAHLKGQ